MYSIVCSLFTTCFKKYDVCCFIGIMSDYFSDCSVAPKGPPAPFSLSPKPLAQEGDDQALQKEPWDSGTNSSASFLLSVSGQSFKPQLPHLLNGANTGNLLMRLLPGFREVRGAEVKTIRDSPKQATNKQAEEGVTESRGLQPGRHSNPVL